jgi:hypothetical protein
MTLEFNERFANQVVSVSLCMLSEKQLSKKAVESRALQFDQIGRLFESCFCAQTDVSFVWRALTP